MPIYDQSFQHYDGPRRLGRLWLPVAMHTVRPILKQKFTYLLLFAVAVPLFVVTILFFGMSRLTEMSQDGTDFGKAVSSVPDLPLMGNNLTLSTVFFIYIGFQTTLFWLLVLIHGSGALCKDRGTHALPLLFSRPLSLRDYLTGKLLGLAFAPIALFWTVTLIVYLQAWAFFYTTGEAIALVPTVLAALAYIALYGVVITTAILACSAAAQKQSTAIFFFLGLYFFGNMAGEALAVQSVNYKAISLSNALGGAGKFFLEPQQQWGDVMQQMSGYDVAPQFCFLALALYMAAFLAVILMRTRVVEVVK